MLYPPGRGMTFLIKLYDDDKKVLKIFLRPHKLLEKVSPENGLLMDVILMHRVEVARGSHFTWCGDSIETKASGMTQSPCRERLRNAD